MLYAYGGTGKTRLSTAFKDLGKVGGPDAETELGDTLYFNEFVKDLFSWDNDLENNRERKLRAQQETRASFRVLSQWKWTIVSAVSSTVMPISSSGSISIGWEVIFAREFRVKKNGAANEEVRQCEMLGGT